jgi:putative ABC transport system permease protein
MGGLGLREVWRFAARGITANRMRSSLTVLGVLIGVSSVIVLTAVGNGSALAVKQGIEKLGTNSILVMSSGGGGRFSRGANSNAKGLTLADAKALNDPIKAPDVKMAAPILNASGTCTYGNLSSTPQNITGTWASYFEASNSPIDKGYYWSNDDVVAGRPVVIIGTTVATDLFGTDSPLNQVIRCHGQSVTVVGVMKSKGSTGGFQDADSIVIAPITFVQRSMSGYGSLSQIQVEATGATTTTAAMDEVTAIMSAQHKIKAGANADYRVLNQASILASSTTSSHTLTVLLAAIAAISLLVGGIGITNIMLVSVTERTREIGIRKAIGAPKSAILTQFLIEAMLLSLLGGISGVALGVGISHFTVLGVKPVVSLTSVLLAFIVSALVGLVFGGWPANRAASLRPIEALRYE